MGIQSGWTPKGLLDAMDSFKMVLDCNIVLSNGWELRDVITSYSQGILSRDEAYDLLTAGRKGH